MPAAWPRCTSPSDLRHDRKVAIKVLRPELAAVIGAERFLSEIRTTANLQHPHILPLFDSGEAEGFLFYVMPYVAGESLRDRLTREHQLPIADAVRIASEVASALDYAHRHGVIHRDIKPENVMLHDGQALVADFGIALAMANTAGTRMTETGMSLGTPHYMSPEQAMGEREITARSDVYALGAITYEMLCRRAAVHRSHRAVDHRPGDDRGTALDRHPAQVGARQRGGRGLHGAGEAAGRSLRHRGGVLGHACARRLHAKSADDRHQGICVTGDARPGRPGRDRGKRDRSARRRLVPRTSSSTAARRLPPIEFAFRSAMAPPTAPR